MLVEGAPGTGKTALAEAIAKATGAEYLYALLHPWSGADELHAGVNVQAAVAGDAERVHQPGVLALAAEASQRGRVVVCLDELDKAPEATEALLLDWLQSGRVPVRPGHHLQTRLDRVLVIITSNGQRELSDALLRRCRRLRMAPMADNLRIRLAAERSCAPMGVVRLIDRACRAVAHQEGNDALSLQEIAHACREAWEMAESVEDVAEIVAAWAARTPEGAEAVRTADARKAIIGAWGEIAAQRRRIGGAA